MHRIERFDVVRSMQGRDEGRLLVVTNVIDESYVEVADGDLRKLEKPKRKKRKHLRYEGKNLFDLIRLSEEKPEFSMQKENPGEEVTNPEEILPLASNKKLKALINDLVARRNEKLGKK